MRFIFGRLPNKTSIYEKVTASLGGFRSFMDRITDNIIQKNDRIIRFSDYPNITDPSRILLLNISCLEVALPQHSKERNIITDFSNPFFDLAPLDSLTKYQNCHAP